MKTFRLAMPPVSEVEKVVAAVPAGSLHQETYMNLPACFVSTQTIFQVRSGNCDMHGDAPSKCQGARAVLSAETK